MKKLTLLIALSLTLLLSCKKDTTETIIDDTKLSVEEHGFYKIGTVIEPVSQDWTSSPVQYSTASGKVMHWNPGPPYAPGTNFPQVAKGTYTVNQEVARSVNGLYSLIYQGDGNLVLYKLAYTNGPITTPALWATNQLSNFPASTTFYNDGNFMCLQTAGGAYWYAGVTSGPNPIWILQDDGNFVGYKNHTISLGNIVITDTNFASTATAGGTISSYKGRVKKR